MSSLLQQSQNKQSFLPSHAPRLSSKLKVVEWKRNFSFPNSLFPMPSLFTSIPNLPKCLILKGLLKSLRIWRYNCKAPLCLLEDGKYSHLCRNEWKTSSSHDQILTKCKSPGQKSHISFLFAGYLSQTRTLEFTGITYAQGFSSFVWLQKNLFVPAQTYWSHLHDQVWEIKVSCRLFLITLTLINMPLTASLVWDEAEKKVRLP